MIFVSKRKNTLPNLETLKLDCRMNQKRYPRAQEGMFSSRIKKPKTNMGLGFLLTLDNSI